MSKGKKQGALSVFRTVFPIVFHSAPGTYIALEIVSFLHALAFVGLPIFFQRLFSVAEHLVNGSATISNVIFAISLLALVNIFWQVINATENFIPIVYEEKTKGKLARDMQDKIARLSPLDFEDTGKLDDINKAEQGKNNAVDYVIRFSWIFSFYIPYFGLMGWYFATLKPILAVLILLIFTPSFLAYIARIQIFSKLEDKSAPLRRESEYYQACIVDREYFKETRLLGAYGYFEKLRQENIRLINDLSFKANLKSKLYEAGLKIITVLGYVGILLLLFYSVLDRSISVGAFASILATITYLFFLMDELASQIVGDLTKNWGTINNYINFLNLNERGGVEQKTDFSNGIEARNVSFTYPAKTTPALKNISFSIKPGETVAIVGENGSGKSTLIKLLTGIYLPSQGEVYFGGTNTGTITKSSLFANMSAIFQKFQQYKMTLEENIGISATGQRQDGGSLDGVCQLSGFSPGDPVFSNGYETVLSREFGGVDLSGGAWQRIAIARGLYRTHEMIVLDEPTAAIDPIEETRVYHQFAQISQGKIAVIVTHRLGSVRLADRIFVLKQGELVESGTHEELLNYGGEYARLYKSQEQWYMR
ncbi:MAG: ABC transporter ATP-binding protein/permease [Peptococcaceae bacterium]|jgi:ATP-binding cassette subfamily B protein|nr:ABC transporter ATP-binding protein/permease [Peptococcaceae bacterium]